jgi:peptidoglycan hydrolase-like protein with peptidoglycan-binding domain
MRTNTRHYALSDLLSDAENIATLAPNQQEQTIAALYQEVEAAKAKLLAMDASGTQPTPAQVAHTQTMMTALSGARQCCPTCRSAQAPMPMMPPSACGAAPMMPQSFQPYSPMTMNSMQPYYGGGMYDYLADDLRKGTKDASVVGGNVRSLQNALNRAGASQSAGTSLIYGVEIISVQVTGTFDDQTERAVKLFQKQRGLPQTGVADAATLSALGISLVSSSSPSSAQSQVQTTKSGYSAETLRLQKLLKTAGYSVATDGVWGSKTEAALIKFQNANGLRGDGIVKDVDWTKLQAVAGAKSGATQRAEAGKNDVPTTSEKVMPLVETGLRVGVPIVAGGVAGFASWKGIKESNVQKKGAYAAAIGLGTALVTYIGTNFLADSLVTIQEQPL